MTISRDRAERIARAHACIRCAEYSYRKLSIRPAGPGHRVELGEEWHAELVCGVCGCHQELGIDGEGDVIYAG